MRLKLIKIVVLGSSKITSDSPACARARRIVWCHMCIWISQSRLGYPNPDLDIPIQILVCTSVSSFGFGYPNLDLDIDIIFLIQVWISKSISVCAQVASWPDLVILIWNWMFIFVSQSGCNLVLRSLQPDLVSPIWIWTLILSSRSEFGCPNPNSNILTLRANVYWLVSIFS